MEAPNPHAGEMLWTEFLQPLGLSAERLADDIAMPVDRVRALIEGSRSTDGELDLRLARYFARSEGFFLRLQNSYEPLEA